MRLATLLGPDIKQILREDPEQIRELLEEIHPEDIADIVADLEPDEAALLLARIPARDAAPIFERLEEHEQEELVEQMRPDTVALIASEMEADDRADLLSVLPTEVGARILASLEKVDPEAAEEVQRIAKWPASSAGHLMTTSYVRLEPRMTVADALATVREHALTTTELIYSSYVLEGPELVGAASLRDLLANDPEEKVADMMRTNVISVAPEDHQEEAARRMAKYDLNAMPVVGEDGALLGVITVDDVIDVLVREQTEDVQKIGGVEPLDVPYFQTGFLSLVKKRVSWLIILFVGEFFTQTAMRHYDDVLDAVHSATYYMPLLLSAGGNSGSQSSTLIIRGLAVGDLKPRDWARVFFRELTMGLALGLTLATIGFGRVLMYPEQHAPFATAVALAILGVVILGCTVGSMLPMLLRRLGLDPATSSTPFIASLVDVLGIILFVYALKLVLGDSIQAAAGQAAAGAPAP